MTIRRLVALLILIVLMTACAPEAQSPSVSFSQEAPPSLAPTVQPSPSPTASPPDVVSPSLSPDPIGDVQCAGGATSGSSDYPADPGGGLPDLEQATRALPGVLPSDEVLIDAERSAVRRDGRVIFVGWWFESATGGWRPSQYVICGDSGIGID